MYKKNTMSLLLTHTPHSPPEQRQAIICAMIFSGISAFGMSYASAWCVRTTSSTTYSMVGSLNKLPIAISGIVFFGDQATFGNISAIFIGNHIPSSDQFFFFSLTHIPSNRFHCRHCLLLCKSLSQVCQCNYICIQSKLF